jgi:hypothetical protein
MTLRPEIIELEIQNLLLQYPELSDDEQLRADMLEGATSAHDFLRFLVKRIGETEAYYSGTKAYVDVLRGRMERMKRQNAMCRALILRLMDKADLTHIPLDIANLHVVPSGRSVVITDEAQIPDDCKRIWSEPNKIVIKEKLVAGDIVPGAYLSNSEPHLTIRTK